MAENNNLIEAIKGWKNAHSDMMKYRSAQSNSQKKHKTVKLNKNGEESKMYDATTMHSSEKGAVDHHENLKRLNPNSKIRHNYYEDSKLIKVLEQKAQEKNYNIDSLIEVYNRGMKVFEEIGDFDLTAEQFAFNRVNSFLNNGQATQMDSDLLDEAKRGPGRPRTRPIKKYNVKTASNRSLAKVAAGKGPHAADARRELAARKKATATAPKRQVAKKLAAATTSANPKQLEKMINAAPKGAVKAELRKVLASKEAAEERKKQLEKDVKTDYNAMAKVMTNPKVKSAVKSWLKSKEDEEAQKRFDRAKPKPPKDVKELVKDVYNRAKEEWLEKHGATKDRFSRSTIKINVLKNMFRDPEKKADKIARRAVKKFIQSSMTKHSTVSKLSDKEKDALRDLLNDKEYS